MKFINNFIIAAALCFFATSCHNSTDNDISGKWLVKEINGKEIQQSMNIPSLTFNTEDNSYHGVTGVNILNGDFKLKDGTISFGDGAMTRMMGDSISMLVEMNYLDALSNASNFNIENNILFIYDKDGNPIISLVREYFLKKICFFLLS